MYPHVVQLETRRHQFARELGLIRERKQPSATRAERDLRGRPAAQTPAHRELGHELTIERTLP
jgi:hypothetical protein